MPPPTTAQDEDTLRAEMLGSSAWSDLYINDGVRTFALHRAIVAPACLYIWARLKHEASGTGNGTDPLRVTVPSAMRRELPYFWELVYMSDARWTATWTRAASTLLTLEAARRMFALHHLAVYFGFARLVAAIEKLICGATLDLLLTDAGREAYMAALLGECRHFSDERVGIAWRLLAWTTALLVADYPEKRAGWQDYLRNDLDLDPAVREAVLPLHAGTRTLRLCEECRRKNGTFHVADTPFLLGLDAVTQEQILVVCASAPQCDTLVHYATLDQRAGLEQCAISFPDDVDYPGVALPTDAPDTPSHYYRGRCHRCQHVRPVHIAFFRSNLLK